MQDTQVADLIAAEIKRQQLGIEMIPSENYVSTSVLKALGSVFTNKYSEGYPGRRYYGARRPLNARRASHPLSPRIYLRPLRHQGCRDWRN